jgi:hypothetical protein
MFHTLMKRLREPRRFIQFVDFILWSGKNVIAIEVKSGSHKEGLPGMDASEKAFKPERKLLVGEDGIPLEKFMLTPAAEWAAR